MEPKTNVFISTKYPLNSNPICLERKIWFLHPRPSMVEVMAGNVRQSTNCKHLSMAGTDLANGLTFQTFSLYEICNLLFFLIFRWKFAQICTIFTSNFWEIFRNVTIYHNHLFNFLRITIMNPKNHPDNRWGSSVPVSNNYSTLKYHIYNRFVEESFFLSFIYTPFFAGSFLSFKCMLQNSKNLFIFSGVSI